MGVDYSFKDRYNIEDLIDIMKILRAPGGCPWDAQQNHESIKKNFIEETYEVVEAINKCDSELLKEELGDVLLQVVFHSAMEEEKGVFDFNDVADGICKKLIVRHPHVFSDVTVSDADEVLSNWDTIKRSTKQQKTTSQAMYSVPKELPALMRADKLQSKASKNGVDTDDAFSLILKKLNALKASADEKTVGELLFAVVGIARQNKIDAENALSSVSDKFMSDFYELENGNNTQTVYD